MSQQELADKLGVRHQQINKYVNNRQFMSYQTAKNIAEIVDCEMSELYEWTWE